jgi:hypothetical protein
VLIGISLFMSACQFPAEPDVAIPGDGLVALRIEADPNGARSVLPSGVTSLDDIRYLSLYRTASTAQDAEEHWLADFRDGFNHCLLCQFPAPYPSYFLDHLPYSIQETCCFIV